MNWFDRLAFELTAQQIDGWLTFLSSSINILGALGVLGMMQRTTSDAGFESKLALIKWAHRGSMLLLALLLFINGIWTMLTATMPRPIDMFVEAALFLAIALSAVRHTFAPSPHRGDEGQLTLPLK